MGEGKDAPGCFSLTSFLSWVTGDEPPWALVIVYFVVIFLYLVTFFLFYFPHYSVAHMATSLSLPFLRKHLGTHANEQMEQTNKRQKNNEYHNWSRKFFFSQNFVSGVNFFPPLSKSRTFSFCGPYSLTWSPEMRSVPWVLTSSRLSYMKEPPLTDLRKEPSISECHTHFTQNPLLLLRLMYKLSFKRYY